MPQEKSPKELIEELYTLFATFKTRMEDPNFIQIENTLKQLMENQADMKVELKEMKRQLLSPFDGVIVETKKNTEARLEAAQKEAEEDNIREEHKELVRFKAGLVKVGWVLLTGVGGILTFLITNALNIFSKG
jgi:cell division protein FtsX